LGWTFSTAVVEVSVDIDTGKVDVLDVWHALDVGRVLNPGTAEGQIEGGAVQGIGYALTEDYLWEKGIVHNTNFTDYKLPVMEGIPRIHCLWVEKPNPGGPFGAKAMGEHSLNPIAPAIANAIYNAIGIRIKSLPITPEKILNALKKNNSLLEEA
jgi:putative selenate reductase molybdopterin-binding subunit